MNPASIILLVAVFAAPGEGRGMKRERRQAQGSLPPVATGEILTSAFQRVKEKESTWNVVTVSADARLAFVELREDFLDLGCCRQFCPSSSKARCASAETVTTFQIPIQTLNAVHDLLQATRGRWNALQERYQIQQQQHPNHRLNPHFVLPERKASQKERRRHDRTQQSYGDQYDRRPYNSKALYQ